MVKKFIHILPPNTQKIAGAYAPADLLEKCIAIPGNYRILFEKFSGFRDRQRQNFFTTKGFPLDCMNPFPVTDEEDILPILL
jgi:hypothetical protein